jgi:hypothetical protein
MARRMFATGLLGAGLLGGCGSSTKTVTVLSAPAPAQTPGTTTQPKTSSPSATTPATTQSPTSTNGGSSAQTSTRAAPEPAFTQQEAKAEGVSGAASVVRAKGFTPNNTSDYHASQALRVLIGTRTGSGDGYGQLAFFFVNGRYIGTDSSQPSATLRVVSQSDTEVALAYPLYRKNDPLCCPGGGQATVHFQLNNGKLTALNAIPSASANAALSRQ